MKELLNYYRLPYWALVLHGSLLCLKFEQSIVAVWCNSVCADWIPILQCTQLISLTFADVLGDVLLAVSRQLCSMLDHRIIDNMPVTWCYEVEGGLTFCTPGFPIGCYVTPQFHRKDACVTDVSYHLSSSRQSCGNLVVVHLWCLIIDAYMGPARCMLGWGWCFKSPSCQMSQRLMSRIFCPI